MCFPSSQSNENFAVQLLIYGMKKRIGSYIECQNEPIGTFSLASCISQDIEPKTPDEQKYLLRDCDRDTYSSCLISIQKNDAVMNVSILFYSASKNQTCLMGSTVS